MIRCIIFDFDGVIADTNNVKTEAFIKIFESYPEEIKESIRKFHLQNGGMSRFDKFRHIYANFLKRPLPEEKFNELCDDFNRFVIDRVINAAIFDGVLEFLQNYQGVYDMHVVSGTPQDEIKEIIKRRGLDKYFLGVYGSPRTKKELIEDIMRHNGYKPQEVVFLGDSINDYEGALGAGVEFVAKVGDDLKLDLFPDVTIKTKIRNIKEFELYLEARHGN